jgi:HAD superfamily hydrolase (TIGR01509 family)
MHKHDVTPVRLLCFDVGNVLVKLGPSMRLRAPVVNQSELERLMSCYGIGDIESTGFFFELKRLLEWRRSLSELRAYFIHQRILGLQSGVRRLFDDLKGVGIPLALLSNTNPVHWEYLVRFPLLNDCEFKLLSFQQGCAKPSERIFLNLEQQSGCSGSQIIFFDDVEVNVSVAQTLGWRAVCIDPQSAVHEMRQFLRKNQIV